MIVNKKTMFRILGCGALTGITSAIVLLPTLKESIFNDPKSFTFTNMKKQNKERVAQIYMQNERSSAFSPSTIDDKMFKAQLEEAKQKIILHSTLPTQNGNKNISTNKQLVMKKMSKPLINTKNAKIEIKYQDYDLIKTIGKTTSPLTIITHDQQKSFNITFESFKEPNVSIDDSIKVEIQKFGKTVLSSSVQLLDGVKHINDRAFKGVILPKNFKIPNSVTHIGKKAFAKAILPMGFTIPNSVTHIGDKAFYKAILPANFTIPNSVTSIGKDAFKDVILPIDYAWFKNNKQITKPTPGARIDKII